MNNFALRRENVLVERTKKYGFVNARYELAKKKTRCASEQN
jgi:hypothetical protein